MEPEPPRRQNPGELLQVTATVAAIAIALATLTAQEENLRVDWLRVDILFLLGGLLTLTGSAFAMAELWLEAGLDALDLMPLPNPTRPERLAEHDNAVRFTAWGRLLIGVAYGAVAVGLS
jgi:hypothetical protein